MSVVYVLAAIGVFTLVGAAYLALGWAYGHNRGHILRWDRLYAHATGAGFGLWRVTYVRDVGDKQEMLLPTRALAVWWVRRQAGDREDIVERGRVAVRP